MKKLGLVLLLLVCICSDAAAAVFQYAIPVAAKKRESTAFLWIPPEAKQVRGVVMGGMTLMERELAADPQIRAACAEQELAIVFLKSGLGAVDVPNVLEKLAEVSGYSEIAEAPILFVGHSAGGPQARLCARQHAERCIALVQYRGADPGDVDHDGAQGIPNGVPALMMIGQFDEFGKIGRDANGIENWEKDRDKLVKFCRQDELNLGCILVEPGAGHYAWSERNAKYLALYIRKVAAARIAGPTEKLKTVSLASGWLSDAALKAPQQAPAPYQKYTGSKQDALWHFDEELARATLAYHQGLDKEDHFLAWKDPHRVTDGARYFFNKVEWSADGQTFEVHPVYAETYPTIGALWGKRGEPVGHAYVPIHVKHASGPIEHVQGYRFRIRHDELAPATEQARVTLMAYSHGDQRYRYTERVGMIEPALMSVKEGQPQKLAFAPLRDRQADAGPEQLSATSEANLPVSFHVGYGPARIEDGRLIITEVPRRAKFPLTIQVVAYQSGRHVEPPVQTAEPVTQTFQLLAP
jgi:pimeloyl-ACP methyl ester carboxylesterase